METNEPETLLDSLVDHGIVRVEAGTDVVRTTDEFEDARALYHDIYAAVSEDDFEATVADLFDLDPADAGTIIEEREITRDQVVDFLAVRSTLDEPVPTNDAAMMAAMVAELGPGSMVPDAIREIDDENYGAFLAAHPDALVSVWKRNCDPCETMKERIDAVLARVPDGVAAAGIEHVPPSAFRREFRVDAAPAFLLFREGEVRERFNGVTDPAALGDAVDALYRSD